MKEYTMDDKKAEAKYRYLRTEEKLSEFVFAKIVELTNKNIELEESVKEQNEINKLMTDNMDKLIRIVGGNK